MRLYESRFLDEADRPKNFEIVPQKLTQLAHVIEKWGNQMSEFDELKSFKSRIHSLLQVSQSNSSDALILDQLEHLSLQNPETKPVVVEVNYFNSHGYLTHHF